MGFEKSERETHITISDEDNKWNVFTRQIKIMNRMKKLEIEPYRVIKDDDGSIIEAEYKLDYKQVSLRNIRQMSEEDKTKVAERLEKARREKSQNQK